VLDTVYYLLSVNVSPTRYLPTFLVIIAFILFQVSYQELYQIMAINFKVICTKMSKLASWK